MGFFSRLFKKKEKAPSLVKEKKEKPKEVPYRDVVESVAPVEVRDSEVEIFQEPEPQDEPDPGILTRVTSVFKRKEEQQIIIPPTFEELIDSVKVYDLRDEQPNPPPLVNGKQKWRIVGGKVVRRDPRRVTGITVHQTAARFGIIAAQIRASGGDRELALARRSKNVACHMMAFADGFVAWPNPLDWYVWHGNDFNSDTLGLEIDGDFPGLMDDPRTAFRAKNNPDFLTKELELAACRALKEMVERGRDEGMNIEWIYAHRQSSPTRRSDPGEEIWKKVVLGYAVPVLGLKTKPGLIRKKGYSIPKEWDPDGPGNYNDRPKM